MQHEWDWARAEAEFSRALELAPRSTDALQAYSVYLLNLGRLDEAIAVIKREIELDPLFVKGHQDLGYVYYLARRFDEADRQLLATRSLDPHFPATHGCLGFTYLEMGRTADAIEAIERGVDLSGGAPIWETMLAVAYATAGKHHMAREILRRLEAGLDGQHVSAALLTWVHTALGDTDAALDCLERAYDERASMLVSLPSALVWDPLRADPRFHALLRRMNFPETAVSS